MNEPVTELNDILFAQLRALSDRTLSLEELKQESLRADAIHKVASDVIHHTNSILKVAQYQHLCDYNGEKLPQMLHVTNDPKKALY